MGVLFEDTLHLYTGEYKMIYWFYHADAFHNKKMQIAKFKNVIQNPFRIIYIKD